MFDRPRNRLGTRLRELPALVGVVTIALCGQILLFSGFRLGEGLPDDLASSALQASSLRFGEPTNSLGREMVILRVDARDGGTGHILRGEIVFFAYRVCCTTV